jgi:hypothetical protein
VQVTTGCSTRRGFGCEGKDEERRKGLEGEEKGG